ncbi:hypothetical protein HOLleu_14975 [Holothuria leucospilota]|uniref:RING-type domain-containing protein n=1 Tax=Holothuria leucospilota TaxID=206669 RepID=A0A9Q1C938_HOLLE|nr:hypothetical protein HOLleu_14975 [Holothuria leucospilota]
MQPTVSTERVNLPSQPSLMNRYHQNDLNSDTQKNATMSEEDLHRKSRHQRHYNEGSKTCSVCGLTVRRQELEIHFQSEIEKLQKLTTEGSRSLRYPKRKRKSTQDEEEEEPVSSTRYEKYLSTRRKRETRKRNKMLRDSEGPSGSGLSLPNCPVCGITLVGTPEEMNQHAEACLNKQALGAGNESDEEDVNIDVDDNFEEYTWCGETRIRATTLLEGGLQGCGYKTVQTSKDENADEELDVEGDESKEFGPSQFTEADLIHLVETPEEETSSRGTGTLEGERHSNVYHDRGQSSIAENNNDSENVQSVISNGTIDYLRPCHSSSIHPKEQVKSLKAQVSALRQQMEERSSVRCLVCLDSYKKPVVSIQCWHVYCEECWMRTLGAKKLCPQCQMITSPSHLRQIFL